MIPEHARLEAFIREIAEKRPFEGYRDQPDTAERTRLAVQAIPFALPEKKPRGYDIIPPLEQEGLDHLAKCLGLKKTHG